MNEYILMASSFTRDEDGERKRYRRGDVVQFEIEPPAHFADRFVTVEQFEKLAAHQDERRALAGEVKAKAQHKQHSDDPAARERAERIRQMERPASPAGITIKWS